MRKWTSCSASWTSSEEWCDGEQGDSARHEHGRGVGRGDSQCAAGVGPYSATPPSARAGNRRRVHQRSDARSGAVTSHGGERMKVHVTPDAMHEPTKRETALAEALRRISSL